MPGPLCRILDVNGVVQSPQKDAKASTANRKNVAKVCVDPGTLEIVSAAKVQLSSAQIEQIQADFERKRRPVLPFADEAKTFHQTVLRRRKVVGPMSDLASAKGNGHESLDRFAEQFTRRPAEHRFECPICQHDNPVRIDRDDALSRCLQEESQFTIVGFVALGLQGLLDLPMLGDVEV